ncbi:hypothetical protein [Persephonella sp.]
MKSFFRGVFYVLVLALTAFAQVTKERLIEIRIIEKLSRDITGKDSPRIFVAGKGQEITRELAEYSSLVIVKDLEKADFVLLITESPEKPLTVPVFALGYLTFKNCDFCIGGLYWRKGRPQLILFEEKLEKFKISLPEEYRFYIISEKEIKQK